MEGRGQTPGKKSMGKSVIGDQGGNAATKGKSVRYTRLAEDINEEEDIRQTAIPQAWTSNPSSRDKADQSGLRKHEIYDNTYYIPNTKVRILETPISSSIIFQMLLYYHFFFDILYLCVIFTTLIYKLWVLKPVIIDVLALIIGVIIWFPVELARLNYGYKGNINETFPELIAFTIFTIFFIVPFSIVPIIQSVQFPHELPIYLINFIFIFFEIVLGFVVMCRFMNTQSAAFYLRTAPLIDKVFQLKYFRGGSSQNANSSEVRSSRQIELGVLRYDKLHDAASDVFKESDNLRPTVVVAQQNNNFTDNDQQQLPFKMHEE